MTDHDMAQRLVLALLLESHPRLLSADDVPRQLPDVPRIREALRVLVEDGLATRLGDLVGASRAAVRFRALGGG